MVDVKVQETQQWLNETYGGHSQWNHVDVDGQIGWQTIFGMIRGLQAELKITTLADNFGDGTMNALTAAYPKITPTTGSYNIRRLAQSALWCHGYTAGFTWGTFDSTTNNAIKSFSYNIGLASLNQSVPSEITPKMLKALMTLDAHTLLPGGSAPIREAQQWLNGKYRTRKMSFLPCDGIFTRSTQQGLMTAIQYELLMTDSQANGNFGTGTKSGLAANANLSAGDTDTTKNWVRLFQCALRMNGYDSPLNGTFDSSTVVAAREFQSYAELPGGGAANFATWASLLISTGDEMRPGTASDMSTQLTPTYCASLYAAGYRTVGRYLSVLGKRYAAGELATIFAAGLRTFPIMQEANTAPSDFDDLKGRDHGFQALRRLRQLGFKSGTTVFFAVDLDALDDTITSRIIPYFQGVNSRLNSSSASYRVGIYGTRNVCARIINAGLASEAFIASMSWGWGGNLGFPLPPAWSYDQIRNHVLSGTNLEIDTNIQSSRANPAGRSDVLPTPVSYGVPPEGGAPTLLFDEDYHWYVVELSTRAELAANSVASANKIALLYLSRLNYSGPEWMAFVPNNFSDAIESDAYNVLNQSMPAPPSSTRGRLSHWAASTRSYMQYWDAFPPANSVAVVGDVGGWGFDLSQAWGDYLASGTTLTLRAWMAENIGRSSGGFGNEDLISDVDAFLVAKTMRESPSRPLEDIVRDLEVSAREDATWRFRRFVTERFGGSFASAAAAGTSIFTQSWSAPAASLFYDGAPPSAAQATSIGLGFADALRSFAEL